MEQNVVAVIGSPHRNGNTAYAVEAIIEGAAESGIHCTTYQLCDLDIKNCKGCRACIKNGGACVIKDDMPQIFEAIKTADYVLIASPIYICQVTGYTKTFLDRLYPLTDEFHRPRFGTRKLIMLYTYGAPVPFLFRRYMKRTGKDLKAMGLRLKKTIILHGCTTIDHTKKNEKVLSRLKKYGRNLHA